MKRYLIFAYDQYYPSGGMGDFRRSFDTVAECSEYLKTLHTAWHYDFIEIIDIQDGVEIDADTGLSRRIEEVEALAWK